jgi:hypothetical protein
VPPMCPGAARVSTLSSGRRRILPDMAEVVISFAGEANIGGYGDKYPFRPCLWAHQGEADILRVWLELDGMTGEIIAAQLQKLGFEDPHAMIKKAILLYGIQRFELLVRELADPSRTRNRQDVRISG